MESAYGLSSVDDLYDSVVKINIYTYNPVSRIFTKKQFGSALVVDSGSLLTNAHVALLDNEMARYEVCESRITTKAPVCFGAATLEYIDIQNDLALMRFVNTPNLPSVQLSKTDPEIGSDIKIFWFGLQWQGNLSASKGIVAGYKGDYFSVDAQINFGDSWWGGFDSNGSLVWVPTFVLIPWEANGVVPGWYLTPVSTISSFLEMTKKYVLRQGSVYNAWYGITSVKPVKQTETMVAQAKSFADFVASKKSMLDNRRLNVLDFSMNINPEFEIDSLWYQQNHSEASFRSKNQDVQFDVTSFEFNGTWQDLLRQIINNNEEVNEDAPIATELQRQGKKRYSYTRRNEESYTESRLLVHFDEKTGRWVTVNYFGDYRKRSFLAAQKMRSNLKIKKQTNRLMTGDVMLYRDLHYAVLLTKDGIARATVSYRILDQGEPNSRPVNDYLAELDNEDVSYIVQSNQSMSIVVLNDRPAWYPTHVVFITKTVNGHPTSFQFDVTLQSNDQVLITKKLNQLIDAFDFDYFGR